MAEGSNPQQAGISITRAFDAPRERVWRKWTEPEPFRRHERLAKGR